MNRLLLKMKTLEDRPYALDYHHDVQGLIYNVLRDSKYDNHDKKGYKFWNFSNIFPIHDLRKGDTRKLLVSSPNEEFISYLKEQLDYLQDIRIGQMKFKTEYVEKLNVRIPNNRLFSLITASPIIARIHKYRFEEIGEQLDHDWTFWTTNHPLSLFQRQLEDNLVKKYNEYYNMDFEPKNSLLYKFKFLKQISKKVYIKRDLGKFVIIGTTWKFDFGKYSKLIQFALDCGFGEFNSMGFGFLNLARPTWI